MKKFKEKLINQFLVKHPRMDKANLSRNIDAVFFENKELLTKYCTHNICTLDQASYSYDCLFFYIYDQIKERYADFIIQQGTQKGNWEGIADLYHIETIENVQNVPRNPFLIADDQPAESYSLINKEFQLTYFERASVFVWLVKRIETNLGKKFYSQFREPEILELKNKIITGQSECLYHIHSIFSSQGILRFQRCAALRINSVLITMINNSTLSS